MKRGWTDAKPRLRARSWSDDLVHKLMLIFRSPADPVVFETRWSEDFVPRAEKMPGLRRVALARPYGGPMGGTDIYLVHEFYFDDARSLHSAMASPEGQAAGRALMAFAGREVTVCFADHLEEARPLPQT